jgi:uncharacterized membrane protein
MLSDHFDLLLMLFSPFYFIFGSITLLIIQLVVIHIGGFGTYKLALSFGLSKKTAVLTCLVFLSSFGVFSAVAFDYHSNVVAACLLPWFVLFIKEEKRIKSTFVFILIIIAKENMALWMFFICTGMLFLFKSDSQRRMAIFLSGVSIIYFIAIIFFVMPALSLHKNYNHFEFHVLGNSFQEVVSDMVRHPEEAFFLLFKNSSKDFTFDYIKTETWIFWLISGGFLFFYRPVFLWMLIPIMMQKMYHDDSGKWGVSGQYSIEFAPLAVWCLMETLSVQNPKKQIWIAWITAFLCISGTIRLCDSTIAFVDKARIRFYQQSHYRSDFNTNEVYGLLGKIPKDAIVSAEGMFVPHLINRKMIYLYPLVKNAHYILLSDDIHSYPLTLEKMLKQIDSLNSSANWRHTTLNNHLYLFEIIEKH